jgi:hypothetical protein
MIFSLRKTKLLLWLFAITVEMAEVWANRFYIEPDGVNYLDLANAWLRHDWRNAISAHWSPLWSWLLGLALWLIRPSPYWESTLVHVVSFLVYLLAFLCFAFFLNQLQTLSANETDGNSETEDLPAFSYIVLGYVFAIHVFLLMIGNILDTPDMCVAALFLFAAALLIRMRRENDGWYCYAALGATLGFAYLAKAIMFPLAFVFLFCALFATRNYKRATLRVLLAFLVFVAIAGPFAVALSIQRVCWLSLKWRSDVFR